jgi:hypothetical protein
MAEFTAGATLELTVPQSELRKARQQIEEDIGPVPITLDTGGAGANARGRSRQGRRILSTLEDNNVLDRERNEILEEIRDLLDNEEFGSGNDDSDLSRLLTGGAGLLAGGLLGLANTDFDLPPLDVDAPDSIPVNVPFPTPIPLDVPFPIPIPIEGPGSPRSPPQETPTEQPTGTPTGAPSDLPFEQPSGGPEPTPTPGPEPTPTPTDAPSDLPFEQPSGGPARNPTGSPSGEGAPDFLPDDISLPDVDPRTIAAGGTAATVLGLGAAKKFGGGLSNFGGGTPTAGAGFPIVPREAIPKSKRRQAREAVGLEGPGSPSVATSEGRAAFLGDAQSFLAGGPFSGPPKGDTRIPIGRQTQSTRTDLGGSDPAAGEEINIEVNVNGGADETEMDRRIEQAMQEAKRQTKQELATERQRDVATNVSGRQREGFRESF